MTAGFVPSATMVHASPPSVSIAEPPCPSGRTRMPLFARSLTSLRLPMISTVTSGRPSSVNVKRVEYRMRSLSVADVSSAEATPASRNVPKKASPNDSTTAMMRNPAPAKISNMPKTRHRGVMGANLRRSPGLAGLRAYMREAYALRRYVDAAEHDRQCEAPGTDRPGIEDRDATIDTDERYVRVAADDHRSLRLARELRDLGAQLR